MAPLVSRRHFLGGAGCTAVIAASPRVGIPSAPAAASVRDFDARSAMRFSALPDVAPYGLKDATVVYAGELWPKKANRSEPDLHYIAATAIPKLRRRAPDLLVLDVEHWDLAGIAPSEIKRNIDRYLSILTIFRQHIPRPQLGLYGVLPVRSYWAPVRANPIEVTAWRRENQALQPIADAVDIVFPSLYTFYEDQGDWITYAKANMQEAKHYGKPVYPFLWPQYHNSRKAISGDFWRVQLETVFNNADGMVIWTPAKGKPRWDPNAPWWLETVDFLEQAGLAG